MAQRFQYLVIWASLAIWLVFPASVGGNTTGRVEASPESSEISEHGLALTLPEGWLQLQLGADYRGVGAYCEAGIVEVLVELLPFDEATRTADLERQIGSDSKREALSHFAGFRGRGFRKSGLTADSERMSFVVFYPDPPAERVAILAICGEADERQLAELEAVVDSLREAPCPAAPKARSITAWGNAPGYVIGKPAPWIGLSALKISIDPNPGVAPRAVMAARRWRSVCTGPTARGIASARSAGGVVGSRGLVAGSAEPGSAEGALDHSLGQRPRKRVQQECQG